MITTCVNTADGLVLVEKDPSDQRCHTNALEVREGHGPLCKQDNRKGSKKKKSPSPECLTLEGQYNAAKPHYKNVCEQGYSQEFVSGGQQQGEEWVTSP